VASSSLEKARELLQKSDLRTAEAATHEYIAQHKNSPDGYFLLGLIYFRQVQSDARAGGEYVSAGDVPSRTATTNSREGKIRDSLAAFTEGAKFGKPSAFDLKIVSLDYVLLGDFASASKWLTMSLEWDPADSEAWYYLGRAKYNENRFEEAIQAFQKCLKLHPQLASAEDGIGLSYAGLNRNEEAIAALQNAISWQENLPQKSPEPYIDLGDLYNQLAKFEDALAVLQKAVTLDAKNIRSHETLGKTLSSLNSLPEAQKELEAAIAIDPDQSQLHYLLGQTYRKQGQLGKAKAELDRFQELKAKEPPKKSGMQ